MIYGFIAIVILIVFSLRYNWWRIPIGYNQARVLMYHSINEHTGIKKQDKWIVTPKDFEKQMSWFAKNGWQSFTISELVSLDKIPYKSLAITFDDGFEDNYTNALSILKKYNFKATIYLVPNMEKNSWEGTKKLLKNEQLLEMQKSSLIEFGSHTLSHANLLTIDNRLVANELQKSKDDIEKITLRECKAFAYPYGKFDNTTINEVKNAGYASAVTVKRGFYKTNDDKFTIKRIGILGNESFFDFYLKITRIRNKL